MALAAVKKPKDASANFYARLFPSPQSDLYQFLCSLIHIELMKLLFHTFVVGKFIFTCSIAQIRASEILKCAFS
jgi:hypothetical protein